jgi:hypothetical protein
MRPWGPRSRPLAFYPRWDRDETFQKFSETVTFDLGLETRQRPSEAKAETFSRDPFVWPLAYIIITAIYTIQIICGSNISDWMIIFLLFLWTLMELQAHVLLLVLYGVSDQWLLSPPHNQAHLSHLPKSSKFRSLLLGHLSGVRIQAPIGSRVSGRSRPPP